MNTHLDWLNLQYEDYTFISFALLCHNETDSLKVLLETLKGGGFPFRRYKYEIIVVHDDTGNVQETKQILEEFKNSQTDSRLPYLGMKVFNRRLNNDFAAQKNYMTERCNGDWIINPDADELFPEYLLENIHLIIEENDTECLWLPRINIVEGMTPELAPQFGFQLNERDWINFPDYQQRIYKNEYPRIRWEKPVHERITGYKTHSFLPFDMETIEHLAIKHIKDLETQIKQNEKYAKIMGQQL